MVVTEYSLIADLSYNVDGKIELHIDRMEEVGTVDIDYSEVVWTKPVFIVNLESLSEFVKTLDGVIKWDSYVLVKVEGRDPFYISYDDVGCVM